MGFMDISGQGNNYQMLPVGMGAGESFILPAGQGVIGGFGGISSPQLGTNNQLSGQYFLQLGQYSVLQMYDVGLNYWQNVNVGPMQLVTISADGANFRIANSTGCPIGALITGAGSAGTNGFYGYSSFGAGQGGAVVIQNGITSIGNAVFTITPSAGGSLWNAIVGGAVSTTMSFSGAAVYNGNYGITGTFGATAGGAIPSAGASYTKPPLIVFSPPPNQGAQPYLLPTAICAISAGAISSITVLNQGAGLLGLPGVVVIPQPGDTTGGGAVIGWLAANNAQVGSGTVLLMWPYYFGTPLTAVPTFTYGGSSNPAPTATAIMNFTITGVAGTPGAGYGTTPGGVINGGIVAGAAANTNPMYDKQLSIPVYPPLTITTATGVPALSGPFQGVNFQAIPTYTAIPNGTAAPGTANASTFTVGGAQDYCRLQTF